MQKNMESTDKTIRIWVTISVIVLDLTNMISGVLAIVLGVLAIVFSFTSFIIF